MAAVTVDPLTVPKLPSGATLGRARPVVSVTTAPQGFEGEGFPVRTRSPASTSAWSIRSS